MKSFKADGVNVVCVDSDCFNHGTQPLLSQSPLPSLRDIFDEVGINDEELQRMMGEGHVAGDSFDIINDPSFSLDGPFGLVRISRCNPTGSLDDPVGAGTSFSTLWNGYSSATPHGSVGAGSDVSLVSSGGPVGADSLVHCYPDAFLPVDMSTLWYHYTPLDGPVGAGTSHLPYSSVSLDGPVGAGAAYSDCGVHYSETMSSEQGDYAFIDCFNHDNSF